MFTKFKKKKKVNNSIYLNYDEFKKKAKERQIDKNEQFLINYYKQLSNKKGVHSKEASHALNCIVMNDADVKAKEQFKANLHKTHNIHNVNDIVITDNNSNIITNPNMGRNISLNDIAKPVDITDTIYLNKFIQYVSDKNEIKFVYSKVLTTIYSTRHKNLDINSIGTFIYELITDFLRNKCLCKRHQIPSYNLLLSFINSIKDQLSYFNDNRNIFTLRFLIQYLPIIVIKFSKNKNEFKAENRMNDMESLMKRMYDIDDTIKEYQNDICDIIDDLKLRTSKLKSNTYPEQIDELNNILTDLRKQIEILAEDLTKVENEQLSAERTAEELRNETLQKFNLIDEEFNINQHIQNVMDENINNILSNKNNNNNDDIDNDNDNRRGSVSKSQSATYSKSQSQSRSHTINSEMASTSIRKPFFVRPLGFDVDLDIDKNELFVSNVTLNSQAYKLKVCRGWKIVMVGREDRVSIMYKILNDANQQTNDDENALPLFITFQVSGLNLT